MAPFRLNTAQLFITYPQSSLNLQAAFEAFKAWHINEAYPIIVIIAEEKHEDGNLHHHVYLKYSAKINIRDASFFDLANNHPNIQGVRSPKHVIKYCTKDGNFLQHGIEVKLTKEANLKRLLEEVNTPEEFLIKVIKMDPEWAISRFSNLRAFTEWKFHNSGQITSPLRPLDSFLRIPREIETFRQGLRTHVVGNRDMRSLWLWGPSRLGKTQLARSLDNHCYMQGIWNMDCLSDNVPYAILDDIDFSSIQYIYKQLFGLQKDVNFTGKYKRPTKFIWGIPIIFITNQLPPFEPSTLEWLDANVDFCHINIKLFD